MEGVYFEDSQPDCYNNSEDCNEMYIPNFCEDSKTESCVQFDDSGNMFVEDSLPCGVDEMHSVVKDVEEKSVMVATDVAGQEVYEVFGFTVEEEQLPARVKASSKRVLDRRNEKGQVGLDDPTQKCSTGCPILDTFLRGGVPCNSITEIEAESGSGKTQLCLQLSLSAQLPPSLGGLSSSSLYLHTKFPFPSRRLHQLSFPFLSMYPYLSSNLPDHNSCDNVYVQSIANADHLLDVITKTEYFLANSKLQLPIKLIVIDSIAALLRSEFENTPSDLKRRSAQVFKISSMLKALAKKLNLALLVTNQAVDVMGDGEGVNRVRIGNLGSLFTSGRRVSPTLGLAWAHCVKSRLFLSRDEHEDSSSCRQTRWISVVFAPHILCSFCEFVIRSDGVFGVQR